MTRPGSNTTRAQREQQLGANVARLLRGAWREDPDRQAPAVDLSEAQLNEIAPMLCRAGAGALAWRRICNTSLANSTAGEELHEVYRRQRLSALIHECEIADVFSLLHN